MSGFESLLTVSKTNIPVLHFAEVAYLYLQVVIPIYHRVMNPIHLFWGGEAGCLYEAFQKFH
jgi:hypothetical protein